MKICYFDAFSGISGDMTVGALVDAGADWGALNRALQSLELDAEFRIEKTTRKGIAASKFSVHFTGSEEAPAFASHREDHSERQAFRAGT